MFLSFYVIGFLHPIWIRGVGTPLVVMTGIQCPREGVLVHLVGMTTWRWLSPENLPCQQYEPMQIFRCSLTKKLCFSICFWIVDSYAQFLLQQTVPVVQGLYTTQLVVCHQSPLLFFRVRTNKNTIETVVLVELDIYYILSESTEHTTALPASC